MKVLRRIGISVLLILFLAVGLCFGQNTAEQSHIKGVEYGAEGKFEEAKEKFERALKVAPFFTPANIGLKIIGDVNKQKIKSKTAIHLFKGAAHTFKGKWNVAISDFNKAIEINPRDAGAYTRRGLAYHRKGQYDKAISDYTRAIEINPRFAEAYYCRGLAYHHKGQYDKAISDYTRAIEINPRDDLAYNNRGYAYYKNKGQYDKAISDYTKAIEINPRYVLAYNNRGYAYHAKGNMKKACSDWKRACELGNCRSYEIAKRKGDCQ